MKIPIDHDEKRGTVVFQDLPLHLLASSEPGSHQTYANSLDWLYLKVAVYLRPRQSYEYRKINPVLQRKLHFLPHVRKRDTPKCILPVLARCRKYGKFENFDHFQKRLFHPSKIID